MGVQPRAGAPYRARTKGTTEAGVKYVKRNALAGRCFASFRALEQHLAAWMGEADRRIHETTHDGAARSVRPRRARGLAPRICAAPAAESGGD